MDFHEPFSSLSHLAFAAFMLFAGMVLQRLTRVHSPWRRWAVGLYTASAVLLYVASGLFHGVRYDSPSTQQLFRRIDLSGIFLLIAGSYLPVFAYLLTEWLRTTITVAVCGLTIVGVVLVWVLDTPKSGTMVPVYAGLAVVGLLPLPVYRRVVGWRVLGWMFAAAGVYALGGACEVLGWPTLIPGVIGPHEVLHVTDVLGTLAHLGLVIWLVRSPLRNVADSHRHPPE